MLMNTPTIRLLSALRALSIMAQEPGSRVGEDSPRDTRLNSLDGAERDEEFNFLDGNISLKAENCVFVVHKFKRAKFRKIKTMAMSRAEIDYMYVVSPTAGYFSSVLLVNASVLISTLRVATRYDHPPLRAFSTQQLELNKLPILDYLPLAREFNITNWEARALDYLESRNEPITEAELLGMKSFVAIVVRRGTRRAQQYKTPKLPNVETGRSVSTLVPAGSRPTLSNRNDTRPQMVHISGATIEQGRKRTFDAGFIDLAPKTGPPYEDTVIEGGASALDRVLLH
ncbi:hypothetical protein FRC10_005583 [Ceratobasidium sp. 414]|nr:hypothetical protein FRC10_005583 [Ceratobasidium sp. 414]